MNGESGDAISAGYGSTIQIVDSTVTNSDIALSEGGPNADLSLTNSTISGNAVALDLTNGPDGFSAVESTIDGNGAGLEGAAFGTVGLADTLVSNNHGQGCAFSGNLTFTDDGYNLADDGSCAFTALTSRSATPAGLDSSGLHNNGGPTQTVLPDKGSPAIGAVPTGTSRDGVQVCPRSDQRGVASQGSCTIGAVELPAPPQPPVTSPTVASHGYWLVGSDGGIFSFGSAQFYGSMGGVTLQRPVVGIVPTRDRGGYWLDASDGGVFSFGDTQFYGSAPGLGLNPAGSGKPNSLNAPIVGMVPSHDQGGYFMVASDGGVFAFGDATFAGSCPGLAAGCNGAAVAVLPDASGKGYWLVTSRGLVYAFGDAAFLGEPGLQPTPITSAVATPDGGGYYILNAAGQVFTYGDAQSFGNVQSGATGGLNPATAVFVTSDNGGYWVSDALGDVFNFGNAPNDGSMAGTRLDGPIIAASGS